MGKVCSVEGCTNKVFSRGLCNFHMPKQGIKPKPKKATDKLPLKQPIRKKIPLKKPKGKKRKPRTKSIKVLKTALDKVFSVYIRLRDANKEGYVTCFTGGKELFWLQSQCGHFMSRRFLATRWHEQNCSAQSMAENIYMSGNQYLFGKNLDLRWGQGTADEMVRLSKTDFKLTIEWLEERIEYFHNQVQILKQEKGL